MKALIALLLLLPALAMGEELKFFSWNVFMLPKPIKFSLQKDRTRLIADHLKDTDYDVLFLEEAFSSNFRKIVGRELDKKFPHQYVLPRSRRIYHIMNSGVFILSRLPFKVLGHYYYNRCAKADCFAAKGVILVEFTTPSGKKIQVGATHMQAGGSKAEIRKSQLQEIKALYDHHAVAGVPQMLIGDLNIDAHVNTEYPEAIKIMDMNNAPLEGELQSTNGFAVACYKVPGEPNAGEWIDHMWLREMHSGAKVFEKKVVPIYGTLKGRECPLSDHYALEAKIKL